MEPRLKL